MSKLRVLAIVLFLGLFVAIRIGSVSAFQNEPDGFRGLKWGDPPTEDMVFEWPVRGLEVYSRPNDEMSFAGVELESITYGFFMDRLCMISMHYEGEENYYLLRTALRKMFGVGRSEEEKLREEWEGSVTYIKLSYSDLLKGSLNFYSATIWSKRGWAGLEGKLGPDGFRDLKWGEPPTEDMVFEESLEDLDVYSRPGDKMSIGDVELVSLVYVFWNNKLMSVRMEYKGRKNYDLLKTILEGLFGKLSKKVVEGYDVCFWFGATTTIVLDEGLLSFGSRGLVKRWNELREKEAIEKAKRDL